jgi:hypothetical protein
MKKLFLTLILTLGLALPVSVSAIDWHTANQVTIAWDAYTTDIQPGDKIIYKVYSKKLPNGEETFLEEFTGLTAVVTFVSEGRYILGVSTVRGVDEDGNGSFDPATEQILESEINWSDVNGENTPNPFGLRYFISPGKVKNLRMPFELRNLGSAYEKIIYSTSD